MNRFLDNSLVMLALLASGAYALSSLGPKSLRRRMWGTLARIAARAPSFLRLDRLARRLGASDQPAAESPSPEVRVPVAKIGRRD